MKNFLLSAVILLASSGAARAQAPVYSNRPDAAVRVRATVDPVTLAGLVARQYVYVAPLPDGPTVTIVPYTPPAPVMYPAHWETPWVVRHYIGRGWPGGGQLRLPSEGGSGRARHRRD